MNAKFYPLILACLIVTPFAKAQIMWPHPPIKTKPQANYRWLLSANPLGTLEGMPSAAGIGFGYLLNAKTEIWAEPSYLCSFSNSSVGGYRVVLQAKRFLTAQNFLAIEGRIKSWHFNDSGTFFNAQANPGIKEFWYHSRNLSYGAALQYGHRIYLGKHWLLEATIGLGIKNKIVHFTGPPQDYKFKTTNIDLNIWDFIESNSFAPYFPGSLRIIYTFGKR